MLRKLVIFAVILAIVGAAAFWFITMPATVPASALAPLLAQPRQRREDVPCRRLRIVPCDAQPGGQDTGSAAASRLNRRSAVLHPEHLARPQRRHRQLERGGFPHRHVEGHFARRAPLLSGFSLSSYQRMKMEDVRDLFAYLKTLPPVEGKPRDHELPFYSISAACWEAGNSFILTAGNSSPIPRSRRR